MYQNRIEPERLEKTEKLVLNTNPLLMDAISAVKYLAGKVEQLELKLRGKNDHTVVREG
ncbi:hypothetical protein [Raoultella terrigena]|uniref:hypothetical protein n=1 Tax=Raoultella terrigena TaxID=577 RepID=UPI001F290B84|nr:hypothetical protein [Raoultella terrigena]